MKNKKKYIFIITILLLCSIIIYLLNENHDLKESSNNYENNKVTKRENMLSMMLETEANSGNYEMTTRDSWPTDGYVFNTELSKCENGGELSWDDENKRVVMSGNVSDKCYVYFDIKPQVLLADYIKSLYTGTQGENSIYYHDASLTNGAGDNSYRYAGASDAVNNYVCFGSTTPCPADNLYRIIGVFDNKVGENQTEQRVKLIKSAVVKNKAWDSNNKNTWSTSSLNTYLNNDFLNAFDETTKGKIADTTWKVGGNTSANIQNQPAKTAYQNEIVSPVTTNTTDGAAEYPAKVGLMYASDYGFAAAPSAWTAKLNTYDGEAIKNVNWMYIGGYEWTISRRADCSDKAFFVLNVGFVLNSDVPGASDVRPVFSLTSSVNYASGSGSATDPISIN